MADLRVKYGGLEFKNPIVAAAGPLGRTFEALKRSIEAGCGAVTLKSNNAEVKEEITPKPAAHVYPRPAHTFLKKYGLTNMMINWEGVPVDFTAEEEKKLIDKIALYQDTVHMLFGPNMQPNTWFDDEKVVCSRTDCTFSPPADMREKAVLCRTLCGGMTDAYMQCEPDLLTARLVDIGEEGKRTRCVHLWTYKPEVFDKLPEDCRANIPKTTKKVLGERGVKGLVQRSDLQDT